jgi:Domain of unknown function (DUF1929)
MKNRLSQLRGALPRKWREHRSLRLAAGAVTLVLPIVVVASTSASAGVNLVVNPGLSQSGPGGFPLCWAKYGYGKNAVSYRVTGQGYGSSAAVQMTISQFSSGARSVQTLENSSCSPSVTPGHQYDLGVWYMSDTPDAVVAVYRHDVRAGWQFWMDLKTLPVAGHYTDAVVRTPVVPPGTDQLSFGVTLYGKGTVVTDDYSMVDATVQAGKVACTAGKACTQGVWQVLPFPSPVRAIHAVLMYTGNVLLVAGSGNDIADFDAGTFLSAVYNPTKGTFQVIPTPDDFFCAGHIQLPNGKVLVLGGTRAYDTLAGGTVRDFEGLNTSYIFNPVTNRYQRVNNLNGGHWYPSATELGNGDVMSFGGLDQNGNLSTIAEYFKYNPNSPTSGEWLPLSEINENHVNWQLYPAMILMQNGELFYTGSHVFGNNILPTSAIYNISDIIDTSKNPSFTAGSDPVTAVPGLQDDYGVPGKDMTDQSMSLLLPPAQSQKVMLLGGGNINYDYPATRLTDLIDLATANPKYKPGPLIPRGKLSNGQLESPTEGKMYVSAVILPNGQVFETGGGLIDREDPVYEASMYNPATNAFTQVAADPVARTYHSSAFLLPDGRVMAIGNNPADGAFNMQISVYSPPYLFDGPRPQVTKLATQYWTYGSEEHITVNQKIVRAELISPASVTHSSDPNQRFVELPLTVSGDNIGLNVTTNPNIAPPGWYMLFVVNANGVPSVAKWVHLNKVAANR